MKRLSFNRIQKTIVLLLLLVAETLILSGCGHQIKTAEEIKKDLANSSQIELPEGASISEISIIKRLTDEKNRSDKVYVSMNIDHENATAIRAYEIEYVDYNEGWLIENVNEYYGEEAQWAITPKGDPSVSLIMEQLKEYSREKIEKAYAEKEQYYTFGTVLPRTYFFEEGKYHSTVFAGNRQGELVYQCIVGTDRVFNYMMIHEEALLEFIFDENSYCWKIIDEVILSSFQKVDDADICYFDGNWSAFDGGVTLSLEKESSGYEYGKIGAIYHGTCSSLEGEEEFQIRLLYPTSLSIDVGQAVVGGSVWGPFWLNVFLTCNGIWVQNNHDKDLAEATPIKPGKRVKELETTGVDFFTTDTFTPDILEISKKLVAALFEGNTDFVQQNTMPGLTEKDASLKELLTFRDSNEGKQLYTEINEISIVHRKTITCLDYLDDKNHWYVEDTLDSWGVPLEEGKNKWGSGSFIFSYYELLLHKSDDTFDYRDCLVVLLKEESNTYVVDIMLDGDLEGRY